MTNSATGIEQNFVIKVICVIGLINASQMITLIFSPMTKHVGAVFPVYFGLSVILSLICLVGLWLLKKWAAITYAALLICNQIVLMVMGYWEFTAVIVPAIVIGLLYKNRSQLR